MVVESLEAQPQPEHHERKIVINQDEVVAIGLKSNASNGRLIRPVQIRKLFSTPSRPSISRQAKMRTRSPVYSGMSNAVKSAAFTSRIRLAMKNATG